MLRLEMLPAAQGDCLWLEYGTPPETRIVIIDGGVKATVSALRKRIDAARRERRVETLDVELLVVTHIDNDHILGIIQLLNQPDPALHVKEIWFNGRPQLMKLPAMPADWKRPRASKKRSERATDLLEGEEEDSADLGMDDDSIAGSASDLLGTKEGDQLTELLERCGLPWNPRWGGNAVMVPDADAGTLPVVMLDGNLKLTVLGPSLSRLYDLCSLWSDVLGGDEDSQEEAPAAIPADLLGRGDTWPPEWKDGEKRDPSVTNGSSIALLAEYGDNALLLTGDAHASDLADALDRVREEGNTPKQRLKLAAFKLSHHGSDKNLTQALLGKIDCDRYLVSTDGSQHRHPDHQALLRILRYQNRPLEILFNYSCATTSPWGDSKDDVVQGDILDYTPCFPDDPARGMILELP
jgi:beta-lactamase superfamily II metal-dependent hydrolase